MKTISVSFVSFGKTGALLAALGAFGLGSASAQISQINVLQTVPGTVKEAKTAIGGKYANMPGGFGFNYFNGTSVERRVLVPWGTRPDYTPFYCNWALSTDGGKTFGATNGVRTVAVADGYVNRSIGSRSGSFSYACFVTPSISPSNTTVALCQGSQSADTGLACAVRFNSSGFIDAYNGTAWSSATSVSYVAGETYYVRFDVNVTSHTYSVTVQIPSVPPSNSDQTNYIKTLATNYAFRSGTGGVAALDTFNTHVNSSPGGTVAVSTETVGHRALIKKRTSGEIMSFDFRWIGPFTHNSSASSFNFAYYKSADGGATWSANNAVVNFPFDCTSTHFHRDVIEENDGALYAVGYAHFPASDQAASPGFWRVIMMKSTDAGATWNYLSTIASSSVRDYTEATVARCADGSWLCIMKATGADNYLRYMRSTDQGASWTGGAAQLPGMTSAFGVDPALNLMPNGILVLSWGPSNANAAGSRDLHVAFSTDGSGTSWGNETTVFTGTWWNPAAPYTITPQECETSGYSAIPAVSAHRFLHTADTGHSWSYEDTIPSPNPFTIQGRLIDIVQSSSINRIDLKTKVALDPGMIDTDMTYTDTNNQESRPSSAVDGSTDYWSGAFKNAASGYYTIDLRQNYTLNKIGVCLHYNTSEGATIERSTDNINWTAIKTYTPNGVNFDVAHGTHRALDYTTFTPVAVRYVRVSVNNSATALVCLNELELYTSTIDTYENNAANQIPLGYSAPNAGFWVSEGVTPPTTGYQSTRALYLDDEDSSASTGLKYITKSTTATTAKTFEFRLRTRAFAASGGAIQFHIRSGATEAVQCAVFSDGSVKYYNGTGWVNTTGTGSPAGTGTVPLDTWKDIKLVATAGSTDTAQLYVDGALKGTVGFRTNVSTLDTLYFGSGGSTPVGDKALFDDVVFQ